MCADQSSCNIYFDHVHDHFGNELPDPFHHSIYPTLLDLKKEKEKKTYKNNEKKSAKTKQKPPPLKKKKGHGTCFVWVN